MIAADGKNSMVRDILKTPLYKKNYKRVLNDIKRGFRKKSVWNLWLPKNNQFFPLVELADLSAKKDLNGAIPVPGPIKIISFSSAESGNLKLWLGLIENSIFLPSSKLAKKLEHNPFCKLPSSSLYWTSFTVKWISPSWYSLEDAIEYNLGARLV